MTATRARPVRDSPAPALPFRRTAPAALAAAIALAYVLIHPMSLDLAAHLLRAKLFDAEGFGLWNNWWYDGHHVPGYSVLFPPLAALLSPQVVGALAAVATAAVFEVLAFEHFGERAWLGSLWFGAATATQLFTGRLTFAFGLLPAVATVLALRRRRTLTAGGLGFLTALASPVAALYAALGGGACLIGSMLRTPRDRRSATAGAVTAIAALAPVAALSLAFPEGGSEPFATDTLLPLIPITVIAFLALPRRETVLRAGCALYLIGCLVAYAITSPVGSNAARLGPLVAGPLAALIWWQRRNLWLAAVALPLLYVQWQAPIRDVRTASGDPSGQVSYWRPLLAFLARQPGQPFRVEIPFTQFHMEVYRIAPEFPLPRGWERQVDIRYNRLFYDGTLSVATYGAWLRRNAVSFVALSDVRLDYAGKAEQALVERGLPYLHLVARTRRWRIYAVQKPTPIITGAARLTQLGPNSLSLTASRPGWAYARVHFTPYWRISGIPGCVRPWGDFTALRLQRTGRLRLVIEFDAGRIGARSARCNGRSGS